MGFVKSLESIVAANRETADFYDAEMLVVLWETKPDIVARLLPPPLKPVAQPLVTAFVANYPSTNFDVTYQESALFLRAEYEGEEGGYCLAMPVTNDIAMAGGREIFGFPKKIADVQLHRKGDTLVGWTERRGVRFMEIRAKMTGKFNVEDAAAMLMNPAAANPDGSSDAVSYNFKHFPAPEGMGFDYNPRLVKQVTTMRPKEVEFGEAEVILQPSDYDPWAEVEVVRVLGAVRTVGDNSMKSGAVVAEVGPMEFASYAFLKWDMK
jgi:acetoacetate decarboxylase